MTPSVLNLLLATGALVALAGVAVAKIGARAGPAVPLTCVGVGLLLGEDRLGLPFDDVALAQTLGLAAVAVILIGGGLGTRISDVRQVWRPACALATIGVFVSVAVIAAAAHYLLGLDWQLALLLGAMLSATDASAVFAVLRRVPLPRKLSDLLRAESGLNAAPALILVLAFSATSPGSLSPAGVLATLPYQLLAGVLVGAGVGTAAAWLLRRLTLPAGGLYSIAVFACGMFAFAAAGMAQSSGFLAAYLAALVLGNARLPHRQATLSLAQGLGGIAQVGLFVMLGLLASPADLPSAVVPALLTGAALLLLARPACVWLTLLPSRVPLREQMFLSWAGLRGAVPIALATVPVMAGTPGSPAVVDIVLVLVVLFTVIQAPPLPWLTRRLGLTPPHVGSELQIETAPLGHLRTDVLHVTVPEGSKLHGTYLDELRLPQPAVAPLMIRDDVVFVPAADTRLRIGDDLLVLTTPPVREATERRLRAVSRTGRLAHWHGDYGHPQPPAKPSRRPAWKSNAAASPASASHTRSSPVTAVDSA
ncbi:potassium/proton antiporter [Actinoplanes sp. NPDC049668]|uniref:potassium/proton antiporter n=1 Tax=unclassified Actinoplanes TaxID=2626549 RepID=UPI0033A88D0C